MAFMKIKVKLIRPETDEEISRTPCGLVWGAAGQGVMGRFFTFANLYNIECLLCDYNSVIRASDTRNRREVNDALVSHLKVEHPIELTGIRLRKKGGDKNEV